MNDGQFPSRVTASRGFHEGAARTFMVLVCGNCYCKGNDVK